MENKCRCEKHSGWSDETETKKKVSVGLFVADDARFSMIESSKDPKRSPIEVRPIIEISHSRYLTWSIAFVSCLSDDDSQFFITAVRDRLFLERSMGLTAFISMFSINESRREFSRGWREKRARLFLFTLQRSIDQPETSISSEIVSKNKWHVLVSWLTPETEPFPSDLSMIFVIDLLIIQIRLSLINELNEHFPCRRNALFHWPLFDCERYNRTDHSSRLNEYSDEWRISESNLRQRSRIDAITKTTCLEEEQDPRVPLAVCSSSSSLRPSGMLEKWRER